MKKLSAFTILLGLFFAFGCQPQKSAEELLSDETTQQEIFEAIISDQEQLHEFMSSMMDSMRMKNMMHEKPDMMHGMMRQMMNMAEQDSSMMKENPDMMHGMMRQMMNMAEQDSSMCSSMMNMMKDKPHVMGQMMDMMHEEGMIDEEAMMQGKETLMKKMNGEHEQHH